MRSLIRRTVRIRSLGTRCKQSEDFGVAKQAKLEVNI
jgi:hypothetical protein